jgi:hypothetical protein
MFFRAMQLWAMGDQSEASICAISIGNYSVKPAWFRFFQVIFYSQLLISSKWGKGSMQQEFSHLERKATVAFLMNSVIKSKCKKSSIS